MESGQRLGTKELFSHIIRDMARAICERPNESKQEQFQRAQAATHMILGLQPRDVVEAMVAGHGVMFHALVTDSVRDTLLGEIDTMRRATRANIVAMDKAFHMNLRRLAHYQARPSEGASDVPEKTRKVSARPAAAAERPRQDTPVPAEPPPHSAAEPEAAVEPQAQIVLQVSSQVMAACRANPEAMVALNTGDPERFARAMGLEMPSDDALTAAFGSHGDADERNAGDQVEQVRPNLSGGDGPSAR